MYVWKLRQFLLLQRKHSNMYSNQKTITVLQLTASPEGILRNAMHFPLMRSSFDAFFAPVGRRVLNLLPSPSLTSWPSHAPEGRRGDGRGVEGGERGGKGEDWPGPRHRRGRHQCRRCRRRQTRRRPEAPERCHNPPMTGIADGSSTTVYVEVRAVAQNEENWNFTRCFKSGVGSLNRFCYR